MERADTTGGDMDNVSYRDFGEQFFTQVIPDVVPGAVPGVVPGTTRGGV